MEKVKEEFNRDAKINNEPSKIFTHLGPVSVEEII